MKNADNKHQNKMKQPKLSITAKLIEPHLMQSFVEDLAERPVDIGYCTVKVHEGWQAIDTSSIQAHVNIGIELSNRKEIFDISYVSCFLFTCIKRKGEKYKLCWSYSLS